MNAQDIINNSNFTDHFNLFYPSLAKQQQADKNITKILKEVK